MNEFEAAALHFGNDAHMAYAAAARAAIEEHQVAQTQLIAVHAAAIVDLAARRAVEVIAEFLEHVACESRAVEAAGARRTAAVGHALELECGRGWCCGCLRVQFAPLRFRPRCGGETGHAR